jgi:translation initiation factor 2-alpha kinase 4
LSSVNAKFYSGGLLFQCLYGGKKRDVFAAGGRYDRLIDEQRPKFQSQSSKCHAVGFNLGWDKLWISMNRYQKSVPKTFLKQLQAAAHPGHWPIRRVSFSKTSHLGEAQRKGTFF